VKDVGANIDVPGAATRRLRIVHLLALPMAAGLVAYWQAAHVKVISDFSYILEYAYRITLGEAPYRDFVIPHPPLTFVVQAAVIALPLDGLTPHWWYCGLAAALTAALTYGIVARQLQIGLPEGRAAASWAFVLTASIVFLNGYAIVAMPFYDCDAVLWVLLAIAAVLWARQGGQPSRHFAAGIVLVLPTFFKQNIGVPALVSVSALVLWSALASGDRSERRAAGVLVAGVITGLGAAALAIQIWIGLPEYLHWTVSYAAQRRWPSARLLISLYGQWRTWLCVAGALAGYAMVRRRRTSRTALWLGLLLVALPLAESGLTMFRWGLASRSYALWGLAVVAGVAAAISAAARHRGSFERLLPLAAIATAHGAFASQGFADSAYAVWPLMIIALAPGLADLLAAGITRESRFALGSAVVIASAGISILGYRHVANEERLGFADLSGPVQRATSPALRGLATPGTYVEDFERLLDLTGTLIPASDAVVLVPGEDPFFFATGRRPRFPIVLFDDTAVPYDLNTLDRLLEERDVRWVIVKTDRQLLNTSWTPLDRFVRDVLPQRYVVIQNIPRYTIFRRVGR